MERSPEVRFPCRGIPPEPSEARLLGIYPQRQDGLFMQRVKVLGGRIRPGQLRGLAELAHRYSERRRIHLTTRQDVELHGLRPGDVPAVQRGIHGLGLTTVGACGDTVRNITVCPHNGFRGGTWDVAGVAEAIYAHTEATAWVRRLPRKFKISLCTCPKRCARLWTNDLGLAPNADGTFQVVLAGSLGTRPSAGVLAYPALGAGDVLPLVTAVLRLFDEEGDRRCRARARLRHVRERLGDEAFLRRVDELFRTERSLAVAPLPVMHLVQADTPLQTHLHLPLGDLDLEAAGELCGAVQAAGAHLRIGLDHDLLAFGHSPVLLPPAVVGLSDGPALVACPGATWCAKGIADSRDAAQRIRGLVPGDCGLSIRVSGCPNNCTLSATGDVGLIGRMRQLDGGRQECFRLMVGGGNGQSPVLGREIHAAVPACDVDRVVAWLVDQFGQARQTGPIDWSDFLARDFRRLEAALRLWYGGPPGSEASSVQASMPAAAISPAASEVKEGP